MKDIEKDDIVYHIRTGQIGRIITLMYDKKKKIEYNISGCDDPVPMHELISYKQIIETAQQSLSLSHAISKLRDNVPLEMIIAAWNNELA